MNTTDALWVPSYYKRPHRFTWVRAAGGPQLVDCVTGVVSALVVLALLVYGAA